jgi:hypothetical protein
MNFRGWGNFDRRNGKFSIGVDITLYLAITARAFEARTLRDLNIPAGAELVSSTLDQRVPLQSNAELPNRSWETTAANWAASGSACLLLICIRHT